MSRISIITTISKKTISMEYLTEGESGIPAFFPRGTWPMPLKDFSSASTHAFGGEFCVDVMGRIRQLLSSLPGCSDMTPTEVPIVFILENDISDIEGDTIREEFAKRGFSSVKTFHADEVIAEYFRRDYAPQGVVTIDSDGTDLFISAAVASQPGAVARIAMPGFGSDPRTDALAFKIWEQVSDSTIDLRYENELTALRNAALSFINSGRSEMEGYVRLSDGMDYDFFANKSMVNNDKARKIVADFTGFLGEYGLSDRSRSVIVMRREAIGSDYLRQALVAGFGNEADLRDNLRDAVIKLAASMAQTESRTLETVRPEPSTSITPEAPLDSSKSSEPEQEAEADLSEPLLPVEIEASVEKVKVGFMKKKTVLKIRISSQGNPKIKWHSVLCIQEKPLSTVEMQNVVKEYDRGARLPFSIELDLPLKQCPDAKKLRIYFKPHPDEPVGINNAYEVAPCSVSL